MSKSSQDILIDLMYKINHEENCPYTMSSILALCRESYQKDTTMHSGAMLLFLMQQFVEEDIEKFIAYASTFASVDDQIMLKLLSAKITKEELIKIKQKDHLTHYLNYVNETVEHMFYDTSIYQAVYLPAYLINNEVKYAHIRGQEDAGLVCTFVSLNHANGFTKSFKQCKQHAIDFYEYNKAGNTPIYESIEHFFVKPLLILKEEFDALEIYNEASE